MFHGARTRIIRARVYRNGLELLADIPRWTADQFERMPEQTPAGEAPEVAERTARQIANALEERAAELSAERPELDWPVLVAAAQELAEDAVAAIALRRPAWQRPLQDALRTE